MAKTSELSTAIKAIQNQQFDDATTLLLRLIGQQPGNFQANWLLLQCWESQGDRSGVLDQLKKLLDLAADNLEAINQLANFAYRRSYSLDGVIQTYRNHLEKRPKSTSAVFNLAFYLAKDGQFQGAIENYRRAIKLGVSAPEEAELNIGNIYMDHLHDHKKAIKHFQQARSLNPRCVAVYHNLGNLAEQFGDRAKAARYFKKCLELEPENDLALARLADTHNFTQKDEPLLQRMVVAALTSSSVDLQFSLGRAFDQMADYEKAWQHFSHANALDAGNFPVYQQDAVAELFEKIQSSCDAAWLDRFADSSHRPVFICGLFRTGSTLLEQILEAHPSFTAGGESEFFPRLLARNLPEYPQGLDAVTRDNIESWRARHKQLAIGLSGGTGRLTDKRPDNFLYAGLIKAILPSAKFIITERDWRDVAVSVFGTRLGAQQNYATRLENIHHYIGLYQELVDHWESILGDDLLRFRYEDLVTRPRETLEKLFAWLGEEWDENCLSFHQQKGTVKTASVWQVREPLHSRSVERWRNYSTPIEKVFDS